MSRSKLFRRYEKPFSPAQRAAINSQLKAYSDQNQKMFKTIMALIITYGGEDGKIIIPAGNFDLIEPNDLFEVQHVGPNVILHYRKDPGNQGRDETVQKEGGEVHGD